MVSSRPANTDLRAAWRRRHAGSLSQGVKVVFLVARTEGELQQGQLEAEQARHGDIVQVRLQYRVKPVRLQIRSRKSIVPSRHS